MNKNEKCIAFGPGKDMLESTKIIAYKQYFKARQLFMDHGSQQQLKGPVRYQHEYIDITKQEVPLYESVIRLIQRKRQQLFQRLRARQIPALSTGVEMQNMNSINNGITLNTTYKTCRAAFGYSFAAGTTDGPGSFDFQQGDTVTGRYWNMVRDFLRRPGPEQVQCHQPKPILLSTGEMDFPYMWHPRIVPTQIISIGQLAILGLPGEFTTMAGRRLRDAVSSSLNAIRPASLLNPNHQDDKIGDLDGKLTPKSARTRGSDGDLNRFGRAMSDTSKMSDKFQVVLSGLSNIYTSYVTTIEEYEVQRYEGASTLYGPHTLQAYINQFQRLADRLVQSNQQPSELLQPPDLTKSLFALRAGVIFDGAPHGTEFGQTLVDVELNRIYQCRETVTVAFVAANPRNDLRQEDSFVYVDRFEPQNKTWSIVATDADWETKFIWERTNTLFGESRAVIQWDIPDDCQLGIYRIRHYGSHKNILQTIGHYSGQSAPFKVSGVSAITDLADANFQQSSNLTQIDQRLEFEYQTAVEQLSSQAEQTLATIHTPVSRRYNKHHRGPSSEISRPSFYSPMSLFSSLFNWRSS